MQIGLDGQLDLLSLLGIEFKNYSADITVLESGKKKLGRSYGDVLQYILPLTGTDVYISYNQFLRPDATADRDTISPDILADYGEDILKVAEDYILNKFKNKIRAAFYKTPPLLLERI